MRRWGLVKYWLMPWLGYHFWMSTFTVVHHTAPHIPFKEAENWNAAKAQLSGTVHCDFPGWCVRGVEPRRARQRLHSVRWPGLSSVPVEQRCAQNPPPPLLVRPLRLCAQGGVPHTRHLVARAAPRVVQDPLVQPAQGHRVAAGELGPGGRGMPWASPAPEATSCTRSSYVGHTSSECRACPALTRCAGCCRAAQYMTECTFNWRVVKNICTECHVYDETVNYKPFDYKQEETLFAVQRRLLPDSAAY
jgi:hypothetical protein